MRDVIVVRDQLISSCDDELAEDLENLYGNEFENKTETELLMIMHQLAM